MFGFRHAIRGILIMFRKERNFKVQFLIFSCVAVLSLILKINSGDWVKIILTSALVLSLETINSSIEKLCDFVNLEENPNIKDIKDISAGAVLIASIFAVVVGVLVLFPYLIR